MQISFPLDNEIFVGSLIIVNRLRDGLQGSVIRFQQGLTMGPPYENAQAGYEAQPSTEWVSGALSHGLKRSA